MLIIGELGQNFQHSSCQIDLKDYFNFSFNCDTREVKSQFTIHEMNYGYVLLLSLTFEKNKKNDDVKAYGQIISFIGSMAII